MRGRCVAACKDQAPKHPFRDSKARTPAVQAIALSTELWPDFSFSPAFVHYRIARRLVEGEESPKVSSARAPKNGLKLVHPANCWKLCFGRKKRCLSKKDWWKAIEASGQPQKSPGSGFGVGPCKTNILSIEIISVLVPWNFFFFKYLPLGSFLVGVKNQETSETTVSGK